MLVFCLQVCYNDSLSAMLKKVQKFIQPMAQIIFTDFIRAKS